MALQHAVEQDTLQLARAVDEVLALAPESAPAVRAVLQRAVAQVEGIRQAQQSGIGDERASDRELAAYFPLRSSPRQDVAAEALQDADADWAEAIRRGRAFREQAQADVGELLTPQQVARRLGVSRATVASWRGKHKLLGVQFDDHQYLFPAFQFVDRPERGERGVLRHLDTVLAALGPRSPWWKARFLRTPAGALGGSSPLEVLSAADPALSGLDRLLLLAHHSGELGG